MALTITKQMYSCMLQNKLKVFTSSFDWQKNDQYFRFYKTDQTNCKIAIMEESQLKKT